MPNPNNIDERPVSQDGGVIELASIPGLTEAQAKTAADAPTQISRTPDIKPEINPTSEADTNIREIPVTEDQTTLGGMKIEVKTRLPEELPVQDIPKL